ncbi:MAG: ANTAR domain-containing response regulator [Eubacteriales bacterium]
MLQKSILLCISNKSIEVNIVSILKRYGFNVLLCEDGHSLIRLVRSRNIDLILLDDEIKGIRAIDIVNIIFSEKIAPVILLVNHYGAHYMDWIEKGWVYNYLNMNLDQYDLIKVLNSAIINGQRHLEMERQINRLRHEIAERKTVEKAKGIIMEKRKCTEDEAYTYLRNMSMNKGISIENISKAIINKFS